MQSTEEDLAENGENISSKVTAINPQTVNATIHRVQELALQVSEQDGKMRESHLEDFYSIAQSLSDLEANRKDLRDQLEAETIESSKKRYAMQILPDKYRKEMEDAVLAARLANENDMKSMQKKLGIAQEETERLGKKHKELAQENARLHPECNLVRREHDEIIAQLNQRMSDKANKQIILNETRDALRDVKHQTKEIDIGHENLAEDMEVERREAAELLTDLKSQVSETEVAIVQQKEKNAEEKRVTDKVLEKIMEMGVKIDEKQKNLRRVENSHARLEMQSLQLSDKIQRERISNQEIFHEKETLQAAKDKRQAEYDSKVEELQKKMRAVMEQIEEAKTENLSIAEDKKKVAVLSDLARKRRSKASAQAKEAAIRVENLKKDTNRMIEAVAEFNQSNTTYREKLEILEENHQATVTTYNAQIDDYKSTLSEERQERIKVQELRDESEKVLETFRSDQLKFMNDMTKSIESARQKHSELSDQSLWFNRETAKNKRAAQTLEVRLEVAQSSFRTMKESLQMDIERLNSSIQLLTDDNVRKDRYLKEKAPQVADLSVEFDERSKEYNLLKNEVVAVRNREKSVNDQITRVKMQIDKLVKPMEKLKSTLEEKRQYGMCQLTDHANERKDLEKEIYTIAMTLENVVHEDEKFAEECSMIESDIDMLKLDTKSNTTRQYVLYDELAKLQKLFAGEWEVCIGMEKASADQDREVLAGIAHLQEQTRDRARVLNGIASNLKNELESLTGFVENVSSRRPKETRQGKRKSVAGVRSGDLRKQNKAISSAVIRPPEVYVTPVSASQPNAQKQNYPLSARDSIAGQGRNISTKGGIHSTTSRPVVTPVGTT
uniref:Myosin-2 heavy chain, non muscle n=1 Tax=Phallusia mammillata TaxID=59560 RepID=A0A6F9DLV0_9ASCI|nr:myosin-2 heavy chain, non muscle [Phallusia mammillata]